MFAFAALAISPSLLQIFAIVVVFGILGYRFLSARHDLPPMLDSAPPQMDEPILESGDLLAVGGLQSVYKGPIAGFQANILTNKLGRVMTYVTLPRDTGLHLVLIGDKSAMADRLAQFPRQFLEPVQLEGDFPDYFRMYCSPEKQIEIREIFEPVTMQLFVDFCRDNDLEIFHETLYMSQAQNASRTGDDQTLTADLTEFLQKSAATLQRL